MDGAVVVVGDGGGVDGDDVGGVGGVAAAVGDVGEFDQYLIMMDGYEMPSRAAKRCVHLQQHRQHWRHVVFVWVVRCKGCRTFFSCNYRYSSNHHHHHLIIAHGTR